MLQITIWLNFWGTLQVKSQRKLHENYVRHHIKGVCMCVCEREREREIQLQHFTQLQLNQLRQSPFQNLSLSIFVDETSISESTHTHVCVDIET
jgi:hypothetical protein